MLKFPSAAEVRKMSVEDLTALAAKVRSFLIDNISATGGHIGANLGVVELTIALHHVFESPQERLIFDTGHQGYTHKLLTEREQLFPSLNKWGGMNRFVCRQESHHDVIDATHAGTSLSLAVGFAKGQAMDRKADPVVAVIGDGSMVEGMAFEGLNYLAGTDLPVVVVLNDNGMAIAPNVGGVLNLTTGENWASKGEAFFKSLGLAYIPVKDGHDIGSLVAAFSKARKERRPTLVHVKTEKGRGLAYAKTHPYKMHFSMPFHAATGAGSSPTVAGETFAVVAAREMEKLIKQDDSVVVLTPATPYASSLDNLRTAYPERVLDVGMAEQHAVGMACGLALSGKKPIVCFQTTFMQRAYDQLLHDACYMNLDVTFFGVRSGFSGYDGATHHGIYDIPYLRAFPNMQLMYPLDSRDLREIIANRMQNPKGPMVILYPYDPVANPEPAAGNRDPNGVSVVEPDGDGLILTLGHRLQAAHDLRNMIKSQLGVNFALACVRQLKPAPQAKILELCQNRKWIVTTEESTLPGGFGSLIAEIGLDAGINMQLLRSGIKDEFIQPGSKAECGEASGIEPKQILAAMVKRWPELKTMSQNR